MKNSGDIHVVTGAFGFSGKYIARRLLDAGHRVITLTNSLYRENPFGGKVTAHPFNFDQPEKMKTRGVKPKQYTLRRYWSYDMFASWQDN